MSIINSQPLIGASGQGGYFLTKSLRFRSSASAYLDRTPSSAGNQRTWTISFWTKINPNGNNTAILANNTSMRFGSTADSNTITVNHRGAGGTNYFLISNPVYRDPSAWYHVVWAVDTTQATESNRSKIYVNGVQVTSFSTANYPPQNQDTSINASGVLHYIGRTSTVYYYDGYLAEYNLIDGQALTPSSFGETSTSTGVWIPKKYTGTYGTNGFYLPFTDVATTSGSNAGLGKDFSGNGNYWTTNNISVTSGSTYDSMKDVPTLTDTDTANYCVLNPLWKGSSITVDEANLKASATSLGSNQAVISSMFVSSGKWYFEYLQNTDSNSNLCVGIADTSFNATNNYVGGTATTYGYVAKSNYKFNNGSLTSYGSGSSANGDVLMCAFDLDNGKIYFGKNGTWYGSGDPAAGTNAAFTGISGTYCPAYSHNAGSSQSTSASFNFGQRPFAYTPPTGFKALNTYNLPTPTIGATASTQAGKYFNTVLYTGNGSTGRAVTGLGFKPDFTWIKGRSDADYNYLVDIIRTYPNRLFSNLTDAASTESNTVTSYDNDGFTVGSDAGVNRNNSTYVAWNWKANGSGSSNTDGSITSTVSANTTAGFSIVTYTGTGSNSTVGHGLGIAPKLIFIKRRDSTSDWSVYYNIDGLGAGVRYLLLNSTIAGTFDTTYWNSTAATSTVFSLGTNGNPNTNTGTYVAYCFAQVAGYSAFGSYTGNGSSDGTFVYTGFRPRYIMIKPTNVSGEYWQIIDTSRNPYNADPANMLSANLANAEAGISSQTTDILSNGFKLRGTSGNTNGSGNTYIYAAFAESPFKYSLAR